MFVKKDLYLCNFRGSDISEMGRGCNIIGLHPRRGGLQERRYAFARSSTVLVNYSVAIKKKLNMGRL